MLDPMPHAQIFDERGLRLFKPRCPGLAQHIIHPQSQNSNVKLSLPAQHRACQRARCPRAGDKLPEHTIMFDEMVQHLPGKCFTLMGDTDSGSGGIAKDQQS